MGVGVVEPDREEQVVAVVDGLPIAIGQGLSCKIMFSCIKTIREYQKDYQPWQKCHINPSCSDVMQVPL